MMDFRWLRVVGAVLLTLGSPAAGQQIVEVPGGDREAEVSLTELYRVGSMAGADWETFADVVAVKFDAAGNLYILDAGNHRVVVVDRNGQLIREFGTEGDGPGELRSPFGMVVGPDGSVAVQDFGHQAFVLYDAEGEYIRNIRNDFREGLTTSALHYHPRHGAVGAQNAITMGPGSDPDPSASIRFVPFAEGGSIEELARAWRPEREESTAGSAGRQSFSGGGGGGITISSAARLMAFTPTLRTDVLPDGRVVVADTAAYQLRLVESGGGVERLLRRPSVRPKPVGERERRAERERRMAELEQEAAEGGGGGGQAIVIGRTTSGGGETRTMSIDSDQMRDVRLQRVEDMGFMEVVPTIEDIRVDGRGRIWVERTGEPFGEPGPVDLVTPDGDYLGTVPAGSFELPRAFGPDDLAVWIETDEFDVEYVVVRRVTGL